MSHTQFCITSLLTPGGPAEIISLILIDHCPDIKIWASCARRSGPVVLLLLSIAGSLWAQPPGGVAISDAPPGGVPITPQVVLSPPAHTSVKFGGVRISVTYSAPSRRKRVIFGGLEPYRKVWRAGANNATALHTDADLKIGELLVPKGDYTLFVWLDEKQWLLIVNKQTGQTGLQYDLQRDLGRVPMKMSRPPKTIEKFRITLSKTGSETGLLDLAWEDTVASVDFTVMGSTTE
jgi:hypothetical protein